MDEDKQKELEKKIEELYVVLINSKDKEKLIKNLEIYINFCLENDNLDSGLEKMTCDSRSSHILNIIGDDNAFYDILSNVFKNIYEKNRESDEVYGKIGAIYLTCDELFNDECFEKFLQKLNQDDLIDLYNNCQDLKNMSANYHPSLKDVVLSKIKNDEEKIKIIEEIRKNFDESGNLIGYEQDDKTIVRNQQLGRLAYFTANLESDERKKEILSEVPGLTDICIRKIICSMQIDDKKIEYVIEKLNDAIDKCARGSKFEDGLDEWEFKNGLRNIEKVIDSISDFEQGYKQVKTLDLAGLQHIGIETCGYDLLILFSKSKEIAYDIIDSYEITTVQKYRAIVAIEDDKDFQTALHEKTDFEQRASEISKESIQEEALDLPENLTIGIELEANGLIPSQTERIFQTLYDIRPELEKWNVKGDGSLSLGTEITSPVLNSSKQSMSELYCMSQAMQEVGFKTSEECGGHIHLGAKYLEIIDKEGKSDKGRPALRNLLHIWQGAEEIIYKMSNGEGKATRSEAFGHYSKEETSIIGESIQNATPDEFESVVENIQKSRYHGLNLDNLRVGGINTIEFRASNGTIDPEEIKQNIYLYGRLMVVAKEMVLTPEKYADKLEQFNKRDLTEAEKVETFLNLIFEDEKQRDVYRRRWESVRDNPVYAEVAADPPRFIRGDYTLRKEFEPIKVTTKEQIKEVVVDASQKDMTEFVNETKNQIRKEKSENTQSQNNPNLDDEPEL